MFHPMIGQRYSFRRGVGEGWCRNFMGAACSGLAWKQPLQIVCGTFEGAYQPIGAIWNQLINDKDVILLRNSLRRIFCAPVPCALAGNGRRIFGNRPDDMGLCRHICISFNDNFYLLCKRVKLLFFHFKLPSYLSEWNERRFLFSKVQCFLKYPK